MHKGLSAPEQMERLKASIGKSVAFGIVATRVVEDPAGSLEAIPVTLVGLDGSRNRLSIPGRLIVQDGTREIGGSLLEVRDFRFLSYAGPGSTNSFPNTLPFVGKSVAIRYVKSAEGDILYDNRKVIPINYIKKSCEGVHTLMRITFGDEIADMIREQRMREYREKPATASFEGRHVVFHGDHHYPPLESKWLRTG